MVTVNKLPNVSDMHVGDIQKKLTIKQMMTVSKKKLSKHIEEITQTPICADNNYCKQLIDIWMKKK